MTDDNVINRLADRYGVEIVWYDHMDDVPSQFVGPAGQGCDVDKKQLHFVNDEHLYPSVEHYLHELVHVVCQPPWWPIKRTPEEFVLFQFERSVARTMFDSFDYQKVIDWQVDTAIEIVEGYDTGYGHRYTNLCDVPEYTKMPFWRLGYEVCKRVGLLDNRCNPTFKWPDWSRLEHVKDDIWNYIHSHAKTPLPKVTP